MTMATPLTYQHSEEPTKWVITYGKCEKSPYVENGLWFVHVPAPSQSTTYLVDEEYARPAAIGEIGHDRDRWAVVAKLAIVGSDWNPKEECRWRDMPYYVHTVPDGTPIRYGLSRSQSKKFPKRELWYVVIGLGYQEKVNWHDYHVFVVDKICTMPEFMNRTGSDSERWHAICWEAPASGMPWYAHIDDFAPDPFSVLKMDEAEKNRSWHQKLSDKIFPSQVWSQTTYRTFMRGSDDMESYDCDRLDEYLNAIAQS